MAEERDIVDVILEEHQDLRALFEELIDAAGDDREQLWRYLVARLASHEAAEEAIVHRAVRDDVPGGGDVAAEVLEEEASAERRIAAMDDLDVTSDGFADELGRLHREVLDHAEHEERDELPKLRETLDDDHRRQMGRRFLTVRDAGPTRPHPHTPQSPEVRAVAGPIVGAFDRARDLVEDATRH